MSQLIRTANDKDTGSTEQRQAVIKSKFNNILQWSNTVSASTKNIVPGTSTSVYINFNSPYFEQEVSHYITGTINNAHGTATLTLKNGPYALFDSITITVNDGNYTLQISKLSQIREIVSEYYLNLGLNIYEQTSFVRNEFTTTSGIAIGPGGSVPFYYDLAPFISFAGSSVGGEIKRLQFDLRCTTEYGTASANKYFLSSTTANLWTAANAMLKDVAYVREFMIIQNPAESVKLIASLGSVPLRHVHWNVEERVLANSASYSAGDIIWSGKLSDIYRSNMVQHVSFAACPVASAWNDSTIGMEYSGYNYLGWKWTTLNQGGNEKTLDMTDSRKLRDFELQQYKNEFGRKQLPLEILTDTSNSFAKYFLRMTRINFDYMQVEPTHEVIRYTSSSDVDYNITIIANTTLTSCELRSFAVIAQSFDYDKRTMQLTPTIL